MLCNVELFEIEKERKKERERKWRVIRLSQVKKVIGKQRPREERDRRQIKVKAPEGSGVVFPAFRVNHRSSPTGETILLLFFNTL